MWNRQEHVTRTSIAMPSLADLYTQDLIAIQHTVFQSPMEASEAAQKRQRLRGVILDMEAEMLLEDPEGLEAVQRFVCDFAARELGLNHLSPTGREEYAEELTEWCFDMWDRCGRYLPAVWEVCTLH